MNKTTLIATSTAALVGAGAAAGAGALAAPSTNACPSKQVRAVRQDIRKAVGRQAGDAARPVIEKAKADGKLTDQQAARLELGFSVRSTVASGGVAAAKPVLDRAVADKTIDQKAADRILQRLQHGGRRQRRRP